MSENRLKSAFNELVNELFGEYHCAEEIIGNRGILTQLNDQFSEPGIFRTRVPGMVLQPIKVRE